MTIRTNTPNLLDNPPVSVQAKLAAAWTSFMGEPWSLWKSPAIR